MTFIESIPVLANGVTAIGVAVAAYQLFFVRRQATTSFEDSLNNQYRAVIERLPIEALFGETLRAEDQVNLLAHFYRYFDLCNEQAFLHSTGRVSEKTWHNWEEGIKSNLARPAFEVAWSEVARRATGDFNSLRALCPPRQSNAKP